MSKRNRGAKQPRKTYTCRTCGQPNEPGQPCPRCDGERCGVHIPPFFTCTMPKGHKGKQHGVV